MSACCQPEMKSSLSHVEIMSYKELKQGLAFFIPYRLFLDSFLKRTDEDGLCYWSCKYLKWRFFLRTNSSIFIAIARMLLRLCRLQPLLCLLSINTKFIGHAFSLRSLVTDWNDRFVDLSHPRVCQDTSKGRREKSSFLGDQRLIINVS